MRLNIIPRAGWGALPVDDQIPLMIPVFQAIHSFTDTDPCETKQECMKAVKTLQETHIKEGLTDIKYNFVIGGDGNVYEGRGWHTLPHLHPSYRELWETSIEVAHIGRCGIPDDDILLLAEDLFKFGVEHRYIKCGFQYHMHFEDVDDDFDFDLYENYARKRLKKKETRMDEKKIIEQVKHRWVRRRPSSTALAAPAAPTTTQQCSSTSFMFCLEE